jgi:hypothetical protein
LQVLVQLGLHVAVDHIVGKWLLDGIALALVVILTDNCGFHFTLEDQVASLAAYHSVVFL